MEIKLVRCEQNSHGAKFDDGETAVEVEKTKDGRRPKHLAMDLRRQDFVWEQQVVFDLEISLFSRT